jgi:hypothetical protein
VSIVGVDLGQSQDYTAISVVERRGHALRSGVHLEHEYQLRFLDRPQH